MMRKVTKISKTKISVAALRGDESVQAGGCGFHTGKGSIIGAGVSNMMIQHIIESFWHAHLSQCL